MKTLLTALVAAAAVSLPAFADNSKITKGYHTMDAMGCMLLRECTNGVDKIESCLLYTSPSPRDATLSRMPSSA